MARLAKPAVSACLLLLLALPSEARQLSQLIQVPLAAASPQPAATSDVLAADPQALLSAVNASYGYLRRIVNPDTGRQVYLWNPATQSEEPQYNIVRHAGTAFGLVDAFQFSGADPADPDGTLPLAEATIDYLLNRTATAPLAPLAPAWVNGSIVPRGVLDDRGQISLGATSLLVLALAKYLEVVPVGERRWDRYSEEVESLAEHIMYGFDGQMLRREVLDPTSGEVVESDIYYPPEATYALARLYRTYRPNPLWRDAAASAAGYMCDPAGNPDYRLHWMGYTLNELHLIDPSLVEAFYPDCSNATATALLKMTGAAAAEGLIALTAAQRREGDRRPGWAAGARARLDDQLALQVHKPGAFADGGIASRRTGQIRNDAVQHFIEAAMGALRADQEEALI